MKILARLITILVLVCISQVSAAVEQTQSEPEMKMDESKMMTHLKMKQEQMLKIHDLSNKILAETDPMKKQALKDQQLELIKVEHMQMMSMHHSKMKVMSK
ncbi:MAG: hypothetical protein NTU70_00485 [Methylococcales bacterium]|jgi:hypothetical protein|nr:hypothetical protein [Methylococcales bacterium]